METEKSCGFNSFTTFVICLKAILCTFLQFLGNYKRILYGTAITIPRLVIIKNLHAPRRYCIVASYALDALEDHTQCVVDSGSHCKSYDFHF